MQKQSEIEEGRPSLLLTSLAGCNFINKTKRVVFRASEVQSKKFMVCSSLVGKEQVNRDLNGRRGKLFDETWSTTLLQHHNAFRAAQHLPRRATLEWEIHLHLPVSLRHCPCEWLLTKARPSKVVEITSRKMASDIPGEAFRLFPKLPAEICLKTWKEGSFLSREIHIHTVPMEVITISGATDDPTPFTPFRFASSQAVLAILATNREGSWTKTLQGSHFR